MRFWIVCLGQNAKKQQNPMPYNESLKNGVSSQHESVHVIFLPVLEVRKVAKAMGVKDIQNAKKLLFLLPSTTTLKMMEQKQLTHLSQRQQQKLMMMKLA